MYFPDDDSPAFDLFWRNSELNATRAKLLRARIAEDAAQTYSSPEPAYPAAPVLLPKADSALDAHYRARRSQRAFSQKALNATDLARLLQPFAKRADGSRPLPSGGGKYPLWLYAGLLNVEGLPHLAQKIAWYDPSAHGLVPVGPCPTWETLAPILGCPWPTAPALVFIVIAQHQVMSKKYGERGGRFTLLEAGCYMGALSLAAAESNLAGVAIGAFDDRQVLALLQLPEPQGLAMFAFALGYPVEG